MEIDWRFYYQMNCMRNFKLTINFKKKTNIKLFSLKFFIQTKNKQQIKILIRI